MQCAALGLTTVVTPTGDPEAGALIAFLVTVVITQIVTIVIQCIALIVQSTATALIYVDSRMRHEGLDLDLLSYVARRDAGETDLPAPYRWETSRAGKECVSTCRSGWTPTNKKKKVEHKDRNTS